MVSLEMELKEVAVRNIDFAIRMAAKPPVVGTDVQEMGLIGEIVNKDFFAHERGYVVTVSLTLKNDYFL